MNITVCSATNGCNEEDMTNFCGHYTFDKTWIEPLMISCVCARLDKCTVGWSLIFVIVQQEARNMKQPRQRMKKKTRKTLTHKSVEKKNERIKKWLHYCANQCSLHCHGVVGKTECNSFHSTRNVRRVIFFGHPNQLRQHFRIAPMYYYQTANRIQKCNYFGSCITY